MKTEHTITLENNTKKESQKVGLKKFWDHLVYLKFSKNEILQIGIEIFTQ